MAQKFDYTPVLKRKIDELIEDIKSLPEAEHAIRELRILRFRLREMGIDPDTLQET